MSNLLPLFPLDAVLLPGAPLPLHVFEPRYKEMIAECLEQKRVFGVLRSKEEEGIAEVGCTAEILSVTKKYPDGRMDILTEGRERFEIMHVNQERSFLQAEVTYLEDEPGTANADEIAKALQLHREIMTLAGEAHEEEIESLDPQLSYHLVGGLPLDLDFKQTLLGMRSEADRLPAVVAFLEAILPTLRRTLHVRRKAGGNGHAS